MERKWQAVAQWISKISYSVDTYMETGTTSAILQSISAFYQILALNGEYKSFQKAKLPRYHSQSFSLPRIPLFQNPGPAKHSQASKCFKTNHHSFFFFFFSPECYDSVK